jgi:Protein of unknown function (DUF2827)
MLPMQSPILETRVNVASAFAEDEITLRDKSHEIANVVESCGVVTSNSDSSKSQRKRKVINDVPNPVRNDPNGAKMSESSSGRHFSVGVTIFIRGGRQSLWENGIFQNCFFLVMLLRCSPAVQDVYLINGGDGKVEDATEFLAFAPAPVIDLDTARTSLDVVIELSAQLNADWTREFSSRGGRVVAMKVANDYFIDIERMMFDRPPGMLVADTPYTAIWTLPSFERSCAGYYEAALRAPVFAMQHLWSPVLLQRTIEKAETLVPFGYVAGRTHWRVAVFEPNICMVKTCHIPMLVADVAHRQDPNVIESLQVYNSIHLKEGSNFHSFANGLDLVRHGIATFEARHSTWEIMATRADAIVSHHWENAQNYLYYEALYGGYPLIHNSDLIGNCGYRYSSFDCHDGALALRGAHALHDMQLTEYRCVARDFLATLDPQLPTNVAQYTAAIVALFQ